MKSLALTLAVLFAASVMTAQSATPTTSATPGKPTDLKAADTKAVDTKAVTAKPADPFAKADAKKDPKAADKKKEPVYTIKGTTIARANGTFLGLQVVNNVYVLSFYDAKKKPAAVDVTRALARWPNPRGRGDYRNVLNVSGTSLVGTQPVMPPYNFNVFITLLKGEGDESKAVENYTVSLR